MSSEPPTPKLQLLGPRAYRHYVGKPHVSSEGQEWATRGTRGSCDTFDTCCICDQPNALHGKLTEDTFDDLAFKVKVGYSNRKRELELVKATAKERKVDEQLAHANTQLEKLKAPPRFFQKVKEWEDSFLHLKFRWKVLALVANSASGKSTFGEGLFANPYVLTVEDAEDLDLRGSGGWSSLGFFLEVALDEEVGLVLCCTVLWKRLP